jgi:hypothetical protein
MYGTLEVGSKPPNEGQTLVPTGMRTFPFEPRVRRSTGRFL